MADSLDLELEALLALPLPRLEKLDIDGTSLIPAVLDEDTFSGEVPRALTNVDVYSCAILPTCPALRAPLTSLKLYDCPIWNSMEEALQTLSELPHLEEFLWIAIVSMDDDRIPFTPAPLSAYEGRTPQSVRLPRLSDLNLRVRVEIATYFFRYIVIPPSCGIIVDADLDSITATDMDALLPALDDAFGERFRTLFPDNEPDAGFRRLDVDPFQDGSVEGVSMTWSQSTTRQISANFRLGFLPSHNDDENVDPVCLAIVCHILENWPSAHRAVSELRNIHPRLFSVDTGSTDPRRLAWARILAGLRRLENVVLYDSIDGFPEAFVLKASTSCLSIRRVDVEGVDFTPTTLARLMRSLKIYFSKLDLDTRSHPPTLHPSACRLSDVTLPDFSATIDACLPSLS
ncbi:unnamed protein product [Peniophora sp. CBMAI 1063]|nr:unnamed protein product [Peniophora sp. CBMAI 1063]